MRALGLVVAVVLVASVLTGQTAWLTGVWDQSVHVVHVAWVQVST